MTTHVTSQFVTAAMSISLGGSRGPTAPIVALFPAARDVPVSEYPPYLGAVEAARAFNSSGAPEFPREVTIVADDGCGAGSVVIELLGEGCAMEIPCRCELPLLVLQLKDLGMRGSRSGWRVMPVTRASAHRRIYVGGGASGGPGQEAVAPRHVHARICRALAG